ncbi:MAG: hypothetical protein ACREEM_03245 [Blastocatellia bacterium]
MIVVEMLILLLEAIARFLELPSRLLQRIADEFKKAEPGQEGPVIVASLVWLAILGACIGLGVWLFSGESTDRISASQPEIKKLSETAPIAVPSPTVVTPSPLPAVTEPTEADMVLEVADIKAEIAETEKELKDARKNAPDDVPDLQSDLADARARLAEAQKALREMRKKAKQ